MTKLYLVEWSPYPGKFWVRPKPKLFKQEMAEHYQNAMLAYPERAIAVLRANQLNWLVGVDKEYRHAS